jgi:MFS family permease
MSSFVRNHDFTVLWIGQTISELGNQMSLFVFPVVAWQISHSAIATALAASSAIAGNVLALLPGGVIADRFDGRKVMRWSSAIGALAFASLVVAGVTGHLTIAHLVAVGVIGGACAGTFAPTETAAIRSVVAEDELPTALSQNQARESVASLAGAPLGGLLLAITRWLPFVADALSYAVSWALLGRLRTDLKPVDREQTRVRDELKEGFAFIWHRPFFRVLTIWAALVNLTVNAVFFLAILRLIQGGFRPTIIGLTEAAAGVAGILGAMAAPRIINRFATGRLTIMVGWSFIPLSIPMIWFNQPWVVILAIGGTTFLIPAGNAGIGAYRMRVTPLELQGRVAAASRFTSSLIMPVAPVIAGALFATLGGSKAMAVLLVATACAALIVTLSRDVRAVPRPDQWDQENTDRSVPVQASRTSSSPTEKAPSTVMAEPPVEPNTVLGMPA